MQINRSFLFLLGWVFLVSVCDAGDLSEPRVAVFHDNDLHEPFDLSAVASIGKYIIVSSDEGHVIQILERKNVNTFTLERKYSVPDGRETTRKKKQDPELDIEGIAAVGKTVYIVGSHSRKRSKVKIRNPSRRSHNKNRVRLTENTEEASRRVLYKLKFDDKGELEGEVVATDLWDKIDKFSELKPFMEVPSKENGIDIEGIAANGEDLYIGFRGPVLRGNWVPVLVTKFNGPPENARLLFVNLGGFGIRDIVAVDENQFLLIAGPVGDGPGGNHLYSWNGLDCVPGRNGAKGKVQHLGRIPADSGGKAEGIAVLTSDEDDLLQLLIVFDGPERGAPALFSLRR